MIQRIIDTIHSQEIYTSICNFLPDDHSATQSLPGYLQRLFQHMTDSPMVLDLGCGEGDSQEMFKSLDQDAIWYGVDIEESPEVNKRVRQSDAISSFNGVDLPYTDKFFDLIYCNQVLEHVRHPDQLLKETFRVLRPGGVFVGSVSYLEPYHSYSIFNFTPFGIVTVLGDAGFDLREIRPESDASKLINRQLLNRSSLLKPLWNINWLYGITGLFGAVTGLGHRERNFLKVQFSGHLIFYSTRPAGNNNQMS